MPGAHEYCQGSMASPQGTHICLADLSGDSNDYRRYMVQKGRYSSGSSSKADMEGRSVAIAAEKQAVCS
ncbi:hypothetical protein NDU88_005996 [Pleurodeles waltl]|uniref:Uncharacterized protein n=1 Tax=Pleurodeles waltl TaxID=8319 RepID=A0AAV7SND3_PLEWA|nr:hypothetical protein NDU88_005996 [Pleurodeles waltl]